MVSFCVLYKNSMNHNNHWNFANIILIKYPTRSYQVVTDRSTYYSVILAPVNTAIPSAKNTNDI